MNVLSRLFTALYWRVAGIFDQRGAEIHRWEDELHKLDVLRLRNGESLETLKQEIRGLEARALKKKTELDLAHGETRRIIAKEIELTFRELDGLRGREQIIADTLEKISVARAKIRELIAAHKQGVSEDVLDAIAISLQDAYADLKASNEALRDLSRVGYRPMEAAPVEVERRLAAAEGQPDAQTGLAPEFERRLAELTGRTTHRADLDREAT